MTDVSLGPYLLIVVAALGALISQLLMKHGLSQGGPIVVANPSQFLFLFQRILTTPPLLLGYVLSFLSGLVWLAILSRMNLSYAAPMMNAVYFMLLLLASSLLLRETVTPTHWLGTALIVTGIFLIGRAG